MNYARGLLSLCTKTVARLVASTGGRQRGNFTPLLPFSHHWQWWQSERWKACEACPMHFTSLHFPPLHFPAQPNGPFPFTGQPNHGPGMPQEGKPGQLPKSHPALLKLLSCMLQRQKQQHQCDVCSDNMAEWLLGNCPRLPGLFLCGVPGLPPPASLPWAAHSLAWLPGFPSCCSVVM